jgi:hypothetical protein
MYTIYSDTLGDHVCLHDDSVTNQSVKVIEPNLTLEDNAAGSLTFKLAPNNVGYETHDYTVTEVASISVDGNYKGSVETVADLANIQDPQEDDIYGILQDSTKRKYVSGEWVEYEDTIITREVTRTYDLVGRMTSTIRVYKDGEEVWEGRVLTEEQDFFNCRKIYCEGELSYLNDTCQPARDYFNVDLDQFVQSVLNYHNQKVDASKQFAKGIVNVKQKDPETGAPASKVYRYTQYEKTMETLNKLVEELGGHLRIRKEGGVRYLDYIDDATYYRTSLQTIKFGKNLLDFTRSYDMSSLCTAVLPTGAVIEDETESSKVGAEVTLYHYPAPSGDQTEGQSTGYILNQKDSQSEVYWTYNEACAGYHTARAVVEPDKDYYVSCRLHGGYVMYCVRKNADGTGAYSADTPPKKASTNIGFTDCVETKIHVPIGYHSILLCGFGDEIPLRVNAAVEKPSEEEQQSELEKYTILEDYDDTDYHQKGSLYVVNQEAVSQYGWIEKRLDLSNIENVDVLYQAAVEYITSGQFDEMTIELSAIDMNLLGIQSDSVWLGDRIRVISEPHGLDKWFPVSKLEIPLDHPVDMKFSLGSKTEQTLTEVNNDVKDDLLSKIAGIPSYNKTLESAKNNAAQLIGAATGGYVTLVKNEDGTGTAEIVISDNPDLTQATNVWVWNQNGLCHSNSYPISGSIPNAAITMDGHMVADYITTGTLRAIDVYGCKVVVGGDGTGPDAHNGYIRVIPNTLNAGGSGTYVELTNGSFKGGIVSKDSNNNLSWNPCVELIANAAVGGSGNLRHGLRIISEDVMFIETRDMGVTYVDNSNPPNRYSGTCGNTYGFASNTPSYGALCFMDKTGNIKPVRCAVVNGLIVPLNQESWWQGEVPTWSDSTQPPTWNYNQQNN